MEMVEDVDEVCFTSFSSLHIGLPLLTTNTAPQTQKNSVIGILEVLIKVS